MVVVPGTPSGRVAQVARYLADLVRGGLWFYAEVIRCLPPRLRIPAVLGVVMFLGVAVAVGRCLA